MFDPSLSATLVKYRNTTMAAADFCIIRTHVSIRRAVVLRVSAADSSHAAGSSPQRLDLGVPVWSDAGSFIPQQAPQAMQITLRQMSEPSVHKRRIYRRLQGAYRWALLPCASSPRIPRP